MDGRSYVAPGGWRVHSPDEPSPKEHGRGVTLGSVRLLDAESDFEVRTSQTDLVTFIQEAVRLAQDPFGNSGEQFQVMVQFTCRPDGHEVDLAYQGDAPQERLQQYLDALASAKRLPVSHGELSFQVEISVDP